MFLRNRFSSKTAPTLLLGAMLCAGLISYGSLSTAKVDLLQIPAIPSVHATRSLLLDVERVGNNLFATGEFGQILKSEDNGKTWVAGKVPVSVTLTSVYFANDALGYAVGHDGVVLKTEDGGVNWVKLIDGTVINQFVLNALQAKADKLQEQVDNLPENASPETRETLEVAAEEAMFLVDTAQGDLEVGPSKPLLDVVVNGNGTVFVAGAYGQLLKSTDQGANWVYLGERTNNPNNYHLNTMMLSKTGEIWVAGEQGTVLVSADEGETWIARKINYDGSIFALVEAPETRTVVAVGLRGNAFRLPFGAAQWEGVNTNLRETFSGATVLADGSMLIVGSRGILVRSIDDFRTIQVVRRPDKLPSASVVQLNDQEILLAGLRGFKTLPLSEFK
ncbi:MAG: hypothetical protein KJ798_11885 [Gammaproteobacteria bacterium]|uniref:WD40/YVTN/BNR-like repeat-containing protein n=1 Tax=Limnobacter sp. TaxID=2003368 RepID=UPI001E02D1A5|nr:YCF48-related protein [Limnobacter sp.]MBU0783702.1 hypothetical protein [Gammaproteobacteria bacterium]MBU0848686.1 hypothetical protein [Gammaproteobacteria bacterium]MBU1266596.1 hypothetical protein [Gammaproteobacteria bacterium]MBU1529172.1 hypothetical protein [Gammaproteobacteria bacterium]MBU1781068.1 hypothetical protein [Gammaproteobacteria bacterium]